MEINKKYADEVLGMCICMTCPSWVNCGERGGYCLSTIGKSVCIEEEKGCSCRTCQAFKKAGLNHTSFCTRGPENEQLKVQR